MVVVSLPGLSEWAQEIEDSRNHLKHLNDQPNTTKRISLTNTKLKRSYDEAEEDPEAMEVVDSVCGNKELKTVEKVEEGNNVVSREHLLNFPLPDVPSESCIVKVRRYFNNLLFFFLLILLP